MIIPLESCNSLLAITNEPHDLDIAKDSVEHADEVKPLQVDISRRTIYSGKPKVSRP